MRPTFFSTVAELRAWLTANHASATEVWVGLPDHDHVGEQAPSWAETLDQALCFGWVDTARVRVDAHHHAVRLAPCPPGDRFQELRAARVAELAERGLAHPAGHAAFGPSASAPAGPCPHGSGDKLCDSYLALFQANPPAWAFFRAQDLPYRRAATSWVMNAEDEETSARRLSALVAASARARRLPLRPSRPV
ncbi:YdeI/OmpD-associated family protein [Marinactinospora thermotolerans]|uniref:YdeI/OmpD-associated family protein n=1 Tax=Marinactinospora thermotolerans TaxID=531310 RepID=UPI003D9507D0